MQISCWLAARERAPELDLGDDFRSGLGHHDLVLAKKRAALGLEVEQ